MAVQEQVAATAPAADWLRDLRAGWQRRLEATPRPTGQEEEWRRTSLDELPWDAPVASILIVVFFVVWISGLWWRWDSPDHRPLNDERERRGY